MAVVSCVSQASALISDVLHSALLAPVAVIPSLGVAIMVYLLVTHQLEMIQDDHAGDEFNTAGERNEWLGGPTSEWLGV